MGPQSFGKLGSVHPSWIPSFMHLSNLLSHFLWSSFFSAISANISKHFFTGFLFTISICFCPFSQLFLFHFLLRLPPSHPVRFLTLLLLPFLSNTFLFVLSLLSFLIRFCFVFFSFYFPLLHCLPCQMLLLAVLLTLRAAVRLLCFSFRQTLHLQPCDQVRDQTLHLDRGSSGISTIFSKNCNCGISTVSSAHQGHQPPDQ